MTKIKTKYNLGDTVYCLQQNIDYVSPIPALRPFTINTIVLTRDGIAYSEDKETPTPEEELFSSLAEAIKFVTKVMKQTC